MLKNYPAQYKKEFKWLKEVDSLALSKVERNLQIAFNNFFKRPDMGFPKFKHKGKKDSYTTNNQKGTVAIDGSFIKLPKIGYIKANIHRSINGLIKSATVSKTPTGKYYVSVLVETIAKPFPKTDSNIGIDLGLTDFTTMLTYKADWYGKTIIKIDRWFPSSKTCSGCGCVLGKDELKLSDRSWSCPSCKSENDRDLNASVNILNEGLRCITLKEPLVQGS